MTMLELVAGITLLIVGVLGFAQTLVCLDRGQARTREAGRATQAARAVLERIQAEAFPEAFRRFNGDGADDPGGANTAPGNTFAVPGLSARRDDADGQPGEVVFPTLDAAPGQLIESVNMASLGMPRDLNGDGAIHATADYSTSYVLLPVIVRVRWEGAAGPAVVELRSVLGNYR